MKNISEMTIEERHTETRRIVEKLKKTPLKDLLPFKDDLNDILEESKKLLEETNERLY